ALQPEDVRERARASVSLLRKGIYRPGAVRARVSRMDPDAFLAWSSRVVLSDKRSRSDGRDERRDGILRSAQELLAEHGYGGTSAEAIAAEAGVAKGLILHHLGSKAGLYLAAVADATARISQAFFEAEESAASDLFDR